MQLTPAIDMLVIGFYCRAESMPIEYRHASRPNIVDNTSRSVLAGFMKSARGNQVISPDEMIFDGTPPRVGFAFSCRQSFQFLSSVIIHFIDGGIRGCMINAAVTTHLPLPPTGLICVSSHHRRW